MSDDWDRLEWVKSKRPHREVDRNGDIDYLLAQLERYREALERIERMPVGWEVLNIARQGLQEQSGD